MSKNILEEKLSNKILIFDGAIGTEIYKRNYFVNVSFENLCLTDPDAISDIHKSYAEAGADVLTTNSFAANSVKLAKFGLQDKVPEINRTAVELAKKQAGENILIAGSVGPAGDNTAYSKEKVKENAVMLKEQINALADAGADFIIFETLSSLNDVETAYLAANMSSELPYILSFNVDRHCETSRGEGPDRILKVIQKKGRKPTALGLNCGEGTEAFLSALEKLMPLVDFPVIVQPNAGKPKSVDNRMLYMASPEYMTTYAQRYVELGARGVGGCCGTGPEHIADIARSISPLTKSRFTSTINISTEELPFMEEVPSSRKSAFAAKLTRGEWVSCVEIVPPRGFDLSSTIEKSIQCRYAGVDAINIPDGPRASSRISPLVTAHKIQEEAGIEAILHFCCRDKNLIGMQAELLGCASLKIKNILFVTGDPPKLGDYPSASGVFDVDSIGMVKIQSYLNRGVDLGGKSITKVTETFIGVGADPNAIDMEREFRRTREKVEAGAEFIITQPVFSVDPLLKFIEQTADLDIPVIAGIWPLASYRNAEFMKNEVPGVFVPDNIMERMASADTKEAQKEEGIAIARESVDAIRDAIKGIQVSAPFGNVNTAISVLRP